MYPGSLESMLGVEELNDEGVGEAFEKSDFEQKSSIYKENPISTAESYVSGVWRGGSNTFRPPQSIVSRETS